MNIHIDMLFRGTCKQQRPSARESRHSCSYGSPSRDSSSRRKSCDSRFFPWCVRACAHLSEQSLRPTVCALISPPVIRLTRHTDRSLTYEISELYETGDFFCACRAHLLHTLRLRDDTTADDARDPVYSRRRGVCRQTARRR